MAWMQKLCETYDNNQHMAGKAVEGSETLAPIYHMNANAQIEVSIDETGSFLKAETVLKENARTLIPVTDASAGRSSGIAPHPLCDTLSYVAGDFAHFTGGTTKKFEAFIAQLKDWVDFAPSNDKLTAIYEYCVKGQTIHDLIAEGILKAEGETLLKDKIEGTEYEKCIVRWRVLSVTKGSQGVWEDEELFDSFIRFYESRSTDRALCYVSLQQTASASIHPKGVVPASYGAKLLGSNDTVGFTYRGRFLSGEEAYCVGNEISQKAHNALKWVVKNQGVYYGGRVFICFSPKGKKVPQPDLYAAFRVEEEEEATRSYTLPEYRERLLRTISGFKNDLEADDDVVIMGLDAATTGRLSITYYGELKASDFLDRIQAWYGSACWFYTEFVNEKPVQAVKSVSITQIIKFTFGTEQGNQIDVDTKIIKEHAQRLLCCIIHKQPVPCDIVRAIALKASLPQTYKILGNRERVLSTACALIAKYRNDKYESEEWNMELDKNNADRSYLFGRLLAIAEKVESRTYTAGEKRETNAMKLQYSFALRPMHTWAILERALIPYYRQLKSETGDYYKGLIADIVSKLQEQDMGSLNTGLDDIYLIGYYLQRKELNEKINHTKNEEEEQ